MSLDLLARKAFGVKGSYLPSAMISFTQIGWFGVGIAMFAIPVANELLGGSKTAEWALVIVAGICMTASAYFGIKSLTIVSYIAVPMVAVLGTVAMVLAVMRGDGTIVDQFAKSSGTLTVVGGAGLVVGSFVSGGTATPNFSRFAKSGKVGAIKAPDTPCRSMPSSRWLIWNAFRSVGCPSGRINPAWIFNARSSFGGRAFPRSEARRRIPKHAFGDK